MIVFSDLQFKPRPLGEGIIARAKFDNGWEVSVVKGPHTYGGDRGLYELAVWKDGTIHYDNEVAGGDVVGYLEENDVTEAMIKVQNYK